MLFSVPLFNYKAHRKSSRDEHRANVPGLFLIGRHLTPTYRDKSRRGWLAGGAELTAYTQGPKSSCVWRLIDRECVNFTLQYDASMRLSSTWIRHNRIIVEIQKSGCADRVFRQETFRGNPSLSKRYEKHAFFFFLARKTTRLLEKVARLPIFQYSDFLRCPARFHFHPTTYKTQHRAQKLKGRRRVEAVVDEKSAPLRLTDQSRQAGELISSIKLPSLIDLLSRIYIHIPAALLINRECIGPLARCLLSCSFSNKLTVVETTTARTRAPSSRRDSCGRNRSWYTSERYSKFDHRLSHGQHRWI